MANIRDALRETNPWWESGFNLRIKDREVYQQVQKFMPMRQIIALTGLRRVGKTFLLYKIVEDSIKKGFKPHNILYFSFDDFREINIREIVKEYQDILEKDIKKGYYLFLFDEIQKLTNWEEQLKRIYDNFGNIKIVISGSESLFLRKKSKESLAGRLFEFKVEPLSFREFLSFKGIEYKPIGLYEDKLRKLFNNFVLSLGFPELVDISEKEIIKKYVKESIVEKIIYRDFSYLFKVKNVSLIESLLNIFIEEPGQLIEIDKLAGELKISRQTLSNYLSYLEESFLLQKLYNFSRSRRKVERKLKKYYPAVVSIDLVFRDDELSRSKVFEWFVVQKLKAEFFWRDPYKNEVDVILSNKNPIPIEIKYRKIDISGLLKFMEKFRVNKGYVITYNMGEEKRIDGKKIVIIPAYKFLLGMDELLQ
ncbi:MAG: ATP-binding protein [candidate division WOR-3 bacterium]